MYNKRLFIIYWGVPASIFCALIWIEWIIFLTVEPYDEQQVHEVVKLSEQNQTKVADSNLLPDVTSEQSPQGMNIFVL